MPIFPNLMLQELRAGRVALGFGVAQSRSVAVATLARDAGYQWLAIDMEHGTLSLDDATQLCMAAAVSGVTPIVRVGFDALDEGTRVLDNGAQGILVPRVETVAQAHAIVARLRYPPVGRRSWGGGYAQFGAGAPVQAQPAAEAETAIFAMIESPAGVAAAAEIAREPGVDGLFIGMSDLALELGIAGSHGHPQMQAAVVAVAAAARDAGKIAGMGGVYDEATMRTYLALGVRLIAGGSDMSFMMSAAAARAKFVHGLCQNPSTAG
jgi:2-keto-3-deoxy-L-rhamnonate aldolase RhmA